MVNTRGTGGEKRSKAEAEHADAGSVRVTDSLLGHLEAVDPKSVWPHEAHDFTPWLLANYQVLGDLLEMDLELKKAEHPVGDFSLDLFGHDLSDDSVVIVENQLTPSDHAHLGQIMTYAGGTNPTTIVWITAGFRPEHRAALDWLNEHTDPNTRFFGIKIEVVKIGDSLPAPNFKVVVQPNDWEKRVKAATNTGELTERGQQYWGFWEKFLNRIASEHSDWTQAKLPQPDSWYDLPTGTSDVVYSTAFTRQGLRVQLYFRSRDGEINQARFQKLHAQKAKFEDALGESAKFVHWDQKPGKRAAAVYISSDFASVTDVDKWPAMIDWLMVQHMRFRQAVEAVGGIKSLL